MRADIRNIALGTLGYSVLTFAWAVAWHVGLFRAAYEEWGYMTTTPTSPPDCCPLSSKARRCRGCFRAFALREARRFGG